MSEHIPLAQTQKRALDPAQDWVIKGTLQQLCAVFDLKPEQIILTSTTDKMRQLQNRLNVDNKDVKLPVMFAKLQSLAINDTQANNSALSRRGFYGQMDDTPNAIQRIKTVMCSFDFEITFVTDDFWKALRYQCTWLLASKRKDLNWTLTYANFPFDIQVVLSSNVVMPERDMDVNAPNYYECISTLTATGPITGEYIDHEDRVSMIRQVSLNVEAVRNLDENIK